MSANEIKKFRELSELAISNELALDVVEMRDFIPHLMFGITHEKNAATLGQDDDTHGYYCHSLDSIEAFIHGFKVSKNGTTNILAS
jgi:flavodoxin